MKLIVGLGNPGKKYEGNRHNVGYMAVSRVVVIGGLDFRAEPDLMCFLAKDSEAVYIKPTTFMNESGNSVAAVSNFYKINKKDVLVVYDELDLDFGKIKLSFGGSSAGHHGVESVIKCLTSVDFARLRIGIGKPFDGAKHVLEDFSEEEKKELPRITELAASSVESFIADGIMATMNRFN